MALHHTAARNHTTSIRQDSKRDTVAQHTQMCKENTRPHSSVWLETHSFTVQKTFQRTNAINHGSRNNQSCKLLSDKIPLWISRRHRAQSVQQTHQCDNHNSEANTLIEQTTFTNSVTSSIEHHKQHESDSPWIMAGGVIELISHISRSHRLDLLTVMAMPPSRNQKMPPRSQRTQTSTALGFSSRRNRQAGNWIRARVTQSVSSHAIQILRQCC
jgi:hypothetical protein